MASGSQNRPSSDSASTLRDVVGSDSTATFEDDPAFVESNPTGTASSENLGAAVSDEDDDEDEDLDEEDEFDEEEDEEESGVIPNDDELDDEDDFDDEDIDEEDEDNDDDDDAVEVKARLQSSVEAAGLSARAADSLDEPGDDDAGDDGRENAVDEDDLNAEAEADLVVDDSSLTPLEQETIRRRMETAPPSPGATAWSVQL